MENMSAKITILLDFTALCVGKLIYHTLETLTKSVLISLINRV